MSLAYSFFENIAARTIHRGVAPWPDLVRRIENVKPVATKEACGLIKLAEFGERRSSGDSLRNNDNVVSVSGLEGDYDAGEVTPEEAVRRLEQHGIRAVVYTSPSHTEARPRWRVLAPLSRPHLPADRRALMARLNGALGGILAPESFTLSQSYYIGRIEGSTYKTLPSFDDPDDGTPIDQLDALDTIAVYPINGSAHATPDPYGPGIGAGGRNRALTSIAGRLRRDGLSASELEAALLAVNRERCTPPLDDEEVRSIARSVGRYAPAEETVWANPRPIVAELPPAPAFNAHELLPKVLADYVLDEADRMSCSPDYIGAALIVAIGAVLGSRCALKPKRRDDWLITGNLFGGVVGAPGTRKSPGIERGLRFLDRLEADEAERQQQRMIEHAADVLAFKAREAAIQARMKEATKMKGEDPMAMDAAREDLRRLTPPEEPHARRFRTNDPTIEKLGDILAHSPAGILVCRDELVGLLASWEKEGREVDRSFYLEAWNGLHSFAIDRIGRGSLLVNTLNISIFGGIQPDPLGRYLTDIVDSNGNDGCAQRFQVMVYPEPMEWNWTDKYPCRGVREAVRDMFLRLAVFDPVLDGAEPATDFVKAPHFSFDEAAQELFIRWSENLHKLVIPSSETALLRQHFSKYEKLFGAIALILHLAEGRIGLIQEDTAQRAASWCEYLADHARRVYGLLDVAQVNIAQVLAKRVCDGKLEDGFTVRDVRRHQWSGLQTNSQIEAAASILEEFGYISGVEQQGDGRPTTRYTINPRLKRGDGSCGRFAQRPQLPTAKTDTSVVMAVSAVDYSPPWTKS